MPNIFPIVFLSTCIIIITNYTFKEDLMKSCSIKLGFFFLLIAIFSMTGGSVFATDKTHKHTYEQTWTFDETNHYHKATCEHPDEVSNFEAHKFSGWTDNKDTTCCKDGTKSRVCKTCRYKETVVNEGSATGKHTFLKTWTGDASGHWHPADCGNPEAKKDFTAKHKFGNYVADNNATCEEDGTQTRTCSICGYKDTVAIPGTKKGHSFGAYTSNYDATCTADGTKTRKCKTCGKKDTVLDAKTAKGHSYSSEWTFDETNHWHVATCEHSDLIKSSETHKFYSWYSNKDATCTEDGTKTRTCVICGYVETDADKGSAKGHNFPIDWSRGDRPKIYKSNNDATCTQDGTKSTTCKTCGYVETVEDNGSAKGHNFPTNDWGSVVYKSNKDATCTQDGTESAKCKTCGYVETVTDYRSAKGHKSDEGTVTKVATTKEDGEKIYKCTVCGEVLKTVVLPKLYAFHETVEKVDSVTYNGTDYDIVTFGDYPQSVKAKDVTVDESNYVNMGRFRYYLGSDGFYYAKVSFKEQDNIFYSDDYDEENRRYYDWDGDSEYFKIEPIRWRVLTKDYSGTKKALLLAEKYLENGINFSGTDEERIINKKTVYGTNYQHSNVRAFLNGISFTNKNEEYGTNFTDKTWENKGFLQTAFTSAAQGKIAVTTVDNSVSSAQDEAKKDYHVMEATYFCENTKDKIFLLSCKEVTTASYGFGLYDKKSASREPKRTDYTRTKFSVDVKGLLRSPYGYDFYGKKSVKVISYGECRNTEDCKDDYPHAIFILPALTISY